MTEKYPKRIIVYFYRLDEFDDSPGNKISILGGVFFNGLGTFFYTVFWGFSQHTAQKFFLKSEVWYKYVNKIILVVFFVM